LLLVSSGLLSRLKARRFQLLVKRCLGRVSSLTYLPARPAGTICTSGAVRVYNGQTDILDARVNGDFIDLRFTNETGAGAGYLVNPVEYIDFDLTGTATPNTEGRISWNPDDGTLEIGLPGGEVVNQIGQEILLPRQVINDVGADCFNGQIIYINSGDNNNLKFKLAKADAEVTSAALPDVAGMCAVRSIS